MRREKRRRHPCNVPLMAGILCVALAVVSSTVYAAFGQAGEKSAGPVTMIDPFALKIILVSEVPTPPGPDGKGPPGFGDMPPGPLIRIPDRPPVRSIFKPFPL